GWPCATGVSSPPIMRALAAVLLLILPALAAAQSLGVPGLDIRIDAAKAQPQEVATALKILAVLTALTLAPAALVVMTAFTRIVVVLAMLRMAIGMQETPPNSVLVSIALFLTLFTMQPVLSQVDSQALQPYVGGDVGFASAVGAAC